MGTFVIAVLLAVVIVCLVRYLHREMKAGKGFCSGDCKHCGHCPHASEEQHG